MDCGQEIRELKLGASFTNPNARTVYHTVKYDFKPASVDGNKEATLETGSNNEVTVTVPHLDGSGVPNTIFKGNQREYTKKECVLIFNRETNEIILEKLNSNIQVKKIRTNSTNKPQPQQPAIMNTAATTSSSRVENQTTRHSSKTRVSTGIRKNQNVLNYVPKHSPLQGSPSYPQKSPQAALQWNANNSSTLPSITSLLDDNFANNQSSTSVYNNNNSNKNNNASNCISTTSTSSSVTTVKQQQQQQQPAQSSSMQQQQQMADDIGELSSSESSSNSDDDSDSDSSADSADSIDNHNRNTMNANSNNNNTNIANHNNNSNLNHKKAPTSMINHHHQQHQQQHHHHHHLDNNSKAALLTKDLCLSDSNSDSDDF